MKAQISVIRNDDGSTVSNNDVIYVGASSVGLPAETDFTFKNMSVSTKTVMVKRTDILLNKPRAIDNNDTAYAYFCTGLNCYPSTTTITPSAITLSSNGTESLKTYLQEASVEGVSTVKYEIYDINNVSDKISFSVSYNNPLSVKDNATEFTNVSDVFPNPTNNKAHLTVYTSTTTFNNVLTVSNALGSIVINKTIDLTQGKNSIQVDADNLSNGIYFMVLSNSKSKIVKKFTINK
jgi:hypothetical protein